MMYKTQPLKPRFELPKAKTDMLAVMMFILGGIFLLWYELCHILPTYYPEAHEEDQIEIYKHYAAAIFFAINIYGNMYKLVTTDTSHRRFTFSPNVPLSKNLRHCDRCDLNMPPRSHHCKICDICVLKRDHHCWFAGYCVGYHNHRYYFAMVIHMVITGLYCNIFNLEFVVSVKGPLTIFTLLSYIGPHFGWLLGYYDIYCFAITLLTSVGTILFFLFLWLLIIQVSQMIYGQTKYEASKAVIKYNAGVFNNIFEVLGKRGFWVLLFPWIPSPLYGDGVTFHEKHK